MKGRAQFGARRAPVVVTRPQDPTDEVFNADEFRAWGLGRAPAQGAASSATGASGGFLVGEAGEGIMATYLARESVMRRYCAPRRRENGEAVPVAGQDKAAAQRSQAQFLAQNASAPDATDLSFTGATMKFDTLTTDVLPVSRELLEDSSVDLERELVAVLASWAAPVLNGAYTNGTGSSVIQGLTESALIEEGSGDAAQAISALNNPYVIARNLLGFLGDTQRANAQFMGTYDTQTALQDARYQAWHYADAVGATRGGEGFWMGRDYIENADLAASIAYNTARDTASVTPANGRPLYAGRIGDFYRIYDAGDMEILRFEDSTYRKLRQVGFALVMRTAGRLVGPARCVLYAA